MLLAIDVGNTNIVYGLFEGERSSTQFRVESARGRTADEYAVALRSLLAMHGVDPERRRRDHRQRRAVAHRADDAARARAFGREALVVGPGIRTGMAILIENPREVGADRIADAVAGFDKAKGRRRRRRLRHLDELRLRHAQGRVPRRRPRARPPDQRRRALLARREAPARRDRQARQGRRAQHGPRDAVGHRLRLRRPRRRPRRAHPRGARIPVRGHRHRRARVAHRPALEDDRRGRRRAHARRPAHPLRAQSGMSARTALPVRRPAAVALCALALAGRVALGVAFGSGSAALAALLAPGSRDYRHRGRLPPAARPARRRGGRRARGGRRRVPERPAQPARRAVHPRRLRRRRARRDARDRVGRRGAARPLARRASRWPRSRAALRRRRSCGRSAAPGRTGGASILLAGVVVNAIASAASSSSRPSPSRALQSLVWWLMGFLDAPSGRSSRFVTLYVAAGMAVLLADAARINVLALGDEPAASLGVDVRALERRTLFACAAVVGAIVSVDRASSASSASSCRRRCAASSGPTFACSSRRRSWRAPPRSSRAISLVRLLRPWCTRRPRRGASRRSSAARCSSCSSCESRASLVQAFCCPAAASCCCCCWSICEMARERSMANCFTSRTWLVASLLSSAVIFCRSRSWKSASK